MNAPRSTAWTSLQRRVHGFLEAIGEVLHAMDAGRQQHPVISALKH